MIFGLPAAPSATRPPATRRLSSLATRVIRGPKRRQLMVRKVAGEDIGARFSDVVESDLVDVNIGIRSMIRWIKV